MLSDRKWKLDAVLVLGCGLMISISLGVLLTVGLKHFVPGLRDADVKFSTFVIGAVSFHAMALVLTHAFLKQHEIDWPAFLGLDRPGLGRTVLIALAVAALVIPAVLWLNTQCAALLTHFTGKAEMQPTMKILEATVVWWQRGVFGFSAVLLAPVAEEVLFRGILYPAIKDHGFPRVALFGNALFFAVIHGSLMTLVPLFFFAIVMTFLYERTGALIAPIAAHSLFNAVNFVMFISGQP